MRHRTDVHAGVDFDPYVQTAVGLMYSSAS
ncbi:hypothetical protein BAL199_25957 [alpha proteobacterium BAL199]|nr:hypothetical protein BAL199_25957 [alpha proteobacterium BAL199]